MCRLAPQPTTNHKNKKIIIPAITRVKLLMVVSPVMIARRAPGFFIGGLGWSRTIVDRLKVGRSTVELQARSRFGTTPVPRKNRHSETLAAQALFNLSISLKVEYRPPD